jgi:NDP-sugar pyrophosphorylase family protein
MSSPFILLSAQGILLNGDIIQSVDIDAAWGTHAREGGVVVIVVMVKRLVSTTL